jgi:hypothetical protein
MFRRFPAPSPGHGVGQYVSELYGGHPNAQASVEPWRLKGASRFSMKNTGPRITCEGKLRPRTVSSMRRLLSKCGFPLSANLASVLLPTH